MTNSKGKFLFLFAGMLLGIVIGGSIMYWAGVRQNGSFLSDFLNAMVRPFDSKHEVVLYESVNLNKESVKESIKTTPIKAQSDGSGNQDTIGPVSDLQPSLLTDIDPISNTNEAESLNTPQSGKHISVEADQSIKVIEDFFLMTDKLLATRTYSLKELNPQKIRNSTEKLDSLIGNSANRSNGNESVYLVEFWESPINYRGYKMGRNRIVIYGIYLPDFVSLKLLNKNIFLKYLNDYYALDFTNEFKPLRVLKNEVIIQELNAE